MPRIRNIRTLILIAAIIAFGVYFLFASNSSNADFDRRTREALKSKSPNEEAARAAARAGLSSDAGGAPRPQNKDAEVEAPLDLPKPAEDAQKAPHDKSVAGRKTMKGGEKWDVATGKDSPMQVDKDGDEEEKNDRSPKEHEVESELNSILKKGPIIVFSKTSCPYSKMAKRILLEKYVIVPSPVVIELDEHELGDAIQAALAKSSGRRTVPNILVNGKSIGGGDDINELDRADELCPKLQSMGVRRVLECKILESADMQ